MATTERTARISSIPIGPRCVTSTLVPGDSTTAPQECVGVNLGMGRKISPATKDQGYGGRRRRLRCGAHEVCFKLSHNRCPCCAMNRQPIMLKVCPRLGDD